MSNFKYQINQYVTYNYQGTEIKAQVIEHVKEPGQEVVQEDGQKRIAKEDDPAYKLEIVDEESSSKGKTVVKLQSNLKDT